MNSTTKRKMFLIAGSSFLVLAPLAGESLAAAAPMPGLTTLAYFGPGAGLGAMGALLAVLGAAVLCIAGLVLYPLQILRNRLRNRGEAGAGGPTQAKPSA